MMDAAMGIERMSVSPEELLAEVEWVRRVARALVGRGESDEVVQQTYLQALATPPAPGPLRRWLRTVVRNVVRRRIRDEATRERHEVRVPVAARTPEPGETVARAELHRRVVEAVLAREDRYRSTLLLRFFEDQSAEAIARAQSLSIETVRTRVKRGIAQLRARLEGVVGGDGEAGAAARALLVAQLRDLAWRNVAPGAVTGAATGAAVLATGGVVMSIAMKGSIAAAVVVVAAFSVWMLRGGDGRRVDVGTATPRGALANADSAELPPPQTASRAPEPVAVAPNAAAKGTVATTTGTTASDCTIEGIVRDVAGRPVAGAEVMALVATRYNPPDLSWVAAIAKSSHSASGRGLDEHDTPRPFCTTTSDGDGLFKLVGFSDEDVWMAGATDAEGDCALSQRLEFSAQRRSVACELTLYPAVELAGRVVATDGTPIGGARVNVFYVRRGERAESQGFLAAIAGADKGTWSTGRHPAESFDVTANAPGFVQKQQWLHVDLLPGRRDAKVEVVLEPTEGVLVKGPIVDESGRPADLRERVAAVNRNQGWSDWNLTKLMAFAVADAAAVPEVGAALGGAPDSGRVLFDEQSYEFRLPATFHGWLVLALEGKVVGVARLDETSHAPPLPFTPPHEKATDTALVFVTVVDGSSGAVVEPSTANVFVDSVLAMASDDANRAPASVVAPAGTTAFIVPLGHVAVRVIRRGFVSSCPELVLSKPGERVEIAVTLSPADCGIRGRALDHDGHPLASTNVNVYRETGRGLEGIPIEPAQTNSDGSFHVRGLAAGEYAVVVDGGKDAAAVAKATAASPTLPPLELTSTVGVATSFHVAAPPAPDRNSTLTMRIVDSAGVPVVNELGAFLQMWCDRETFSATLAPGRYRVFVWVRACREASVEFDVPAAGTVEIPVERIETRR